MYMHGIAEPEEQIESCQAGFLMEGVPGIPSQTFFLMVLAVTFWCVEHDVIGTNVRILRETQM